MAAGGNDVEVRFGATIDDFKSKMAEVQGIFGQVAQRWLALTAVVAGGAAFKEFVAHANAVNVEAEKMSRTLGITAEEAGTIAVAIDDVGQEMGIAGASAETYTSSFLKFNRMLRSSSDEMKKLGVDVDALKSGQKTSNEVFMEAVQIVGKYKPGIDQTQAAMKLFGRSVEDVQLLMGLTKERMDAARKSQQELNLTITAEGVAAAKAYRVAIDGVGDVLEGFKKTVGEAVMPMLTELAEFMASFGPTLIEATQATVDTVVSIWQSLRDAVRAVWSVISEVLADISKDIAAAFGENAIGPMEIFKNALRLVAAAFVAFRIGVETVANVVRTVINLLTAGFSTFGEVASAALRLDWEGVKAAMRRGQADAARVLQEGVDKAVAIAVKGREDLDKALVGGPAPKTPAGGPEGKGTKKFEIKDPNADAAAAAQAALERARLQASLALQLEYLRQSQAINDDAYANNLITAKAYYDQKLAVDLAGADLTLASKRREMEELQKLAAKADKPQQKIQFQAQETALLGQINVLEAKRADTIRANTAEYQKAEQARVDALNAIAAARTKAGADGDVSRERAAMEQELALRRINAEQALAIQRDLEERSYRATVEALQAKAAAIHGTEGDAQKQREQLYAEAEAAERDHQDRLTAISNAAERERLKYSLQAQDGVRGGFQDLVAGALNGMTKVSDLVRNFAQSVANTFVNLIAQKFTERLFDATGVNQAIESMVSFLTEGISSIVAKWFGMESAKTAASTAGATTRKGVVVAEAATEKAVVVGSAAVTEGAEAVKTAATVAGASVRSTTEVAAAATSTSASLGSSIANIGAKAWEAAAAVYAAIAAIPVVGPFLAPAAAFAAGAVVLGFVGKIASSEGGEYRVDQDRLNIVHKNETILPAPFAQGLRELVGKGGVAPLVTAVDQIVTRLAPEGIRSSAPQTLEGAASPAKAFAQAEPAEQVRKAAGEDPGQPAAPSLQAQTPVAAPPGSAPAAAIAAVESAADRIEQAREPTAAGPRAAPQLLAAAAGQPGSGGEAGAAGAPATAAAGAPGVPGAPGSAQSTSSSTASTVSPEAGSVPPIAPIVTPAAPSVTLAAPIVTAAAGAPGLPGAAVEPVAADAAAALVPRAPAPVPPSVKSEPLSPLERQPATETAPTRADATASFAAAKPEVERAMVPPERDQAPAPAVYPTTVGAGSPVGSAAATAPAAAPSWWRVPSSPLAQIQAQATTTPAATPPSAASADSASGRPIAELRGASAGEFFIAYRKDLLKVLGDAGRDMRKPR